MVMPPLGAPSENDLLDEAPTRGSQHVHFPRPPPPVAALPTSAHSGAEVERECLLLRYWAASRPIGRIALATVPSRRGCRALRAAWTLMRMTVHPQRDTLGCRGCGEYPVYSTCGRCSTKWCTYCTTWSPLCWKCYRPRQQLNDCGEFVVGGSAADAATDCGGPSGAGVLENLS